MTKTTLTVPTVHLNGTSKEALLKAYEEAGQAVQRALETLREARPNGRDYYVQPPGAFARAQDESDNREQRLQSVADEFEQLAEAVDAQGRR